jgi:hypothetical protein
VVLIEHTLLSQDQAIARSQNRPVSCPAYRDEAVRCELAVSLLSEPNYVEYVKSVYQQLGIPHPDTCSRRSYSDVFGASTGSYGTGVATPGEETGSPLDLCRQQDEAPGCVRDHLGRSPLWIAAYYGNLPQIKYLLQHGADRNQVAVPLCRTTSGSGVVGGPCLCVCTRHTTPRAPSRMQRPLPHRLTTACHTATWLVLVWVVGHVALHGPQGGGAAAWLGRPISPSAGAPQ